MLIFNLMLLNKLFKIADVHFLLKYVKNVNIYFEIIKILLIIHFFK